ADPLMLTLGEDGVQRAQFSGMAISGDTAGDHLYLGNLSGGTAIRLISQRPESSTIEAALSVLDSGGNVVASGAPDAGELDHFVVPGQEGGYYVHVTGTPRGLDSQYLLW